MFGMSADGGVTSDRFPNCRAITNPIAAVGGDILAIVGKGHGPRSRDACSQLKGLRAKALGRMAMRSTGLNGTLWCGQMGVSELEKLPRYGCATCIGIDEGQTRASQT